ncbi:MAG TPA: hypothetical protein VMR46_03620 [Candidatus Paceibacterota bacterium]|jgi:hypothetical protein|nr:hypothetical protein [Candidatus Paceibacterota bacterium]
MWQLEELVKECPVGSALVGVALMIGLGCCITAMHYGAKQRNIRNQANMLVSLLYWNREIDAFGWNTEPSYGGLTDTCLCIWAGGPDWLHYLKQGVPEYERKNKGIPPHQITEAFQIGSAYGELTEDVLKLAASKLTGNTVFNVCVTTKPYGGGSSGSIRKKGRQPNLAAA